MHGRNLIPALILGLFGALIGAPVAASGSGVVISQVYGGGGNSGAPWQNDYIELFNAGDTTVDIGGWSVQYASAAGSSWANTTAIPVGTSLQPGQYYLIAEGAGNGNGAALPAPDLSGSIMLSASQGKVALVSATGQLSGACPLSDSRLVDFIGFGGANCFEGTAAAPGLGNTTAALRALDGCIDSDDNHDDFTAGAPNPRNTTTSPNPCGGNGNVILSVADISLAEGDSGDTPFNFNISLNNPAPAGGVSFDIATEDGSATAGSDYEARSLTGVSIAEGDSSYVFTVTVHGDTEPEPDETFRVKISNITGAVNDTATATGTILNDDMASAAIWEIQGNGASSPMEGQRVHTCGIVTAVGSGGFYLQSSGDPGDGPLCATDGDSLTSDGIYVFSNASVTSGDLITLEAKVEEYFELTELTGVSNLQTVSQGKQLPPAVEFGQSIPSSDPDDLSCGDTNFECFEGMLVRIDDGMVTQARGYSSAHAYDYVYVTANGRRSLRGPGLRYGLTPVTGDNDAAGIWSGNPEVFEMSPNEFAGVNDDTQPINGGSRFSATGVIGYSFGNYVFYPIELDVSDRTTMPRPVAEPGHPAILRIGDFNVERFCDDAADPDKPYECAGNSVPTPGEYQLKVARLSDYIGNVLRLPDVVALQEVENIDVLEALADRIASDHGLTYTPKLIEGNDPSGIDVGYLVNTARVEVTGLVQLAADETWDDPENGSSQIHDHPPLLLHGNFLGEGSLAQPFMLITVHMKARSQVDGSGAAAERDRQKRLQQAWSLAQQVQGLQTDPANAGVPLVVLGDFNDYEFSDGFVDIVGMVSGRYDFAANLWDLSDIGLPDQNVVDPTLWDAVYFLPDNERYSYLYTENFGNIQGFEPRKVPTNQVLDHALLNTHARAGFITMEYGRANQDAASEDMRNSTGAIGVSDHDGFVLTLTFDRIFADGFGNLD